MDHGWFEDPAVAPHRVLRGPYEGMWDATLVTVEGRPVLAFPRAGAHARAPVAAVDLETGAPLAERSGLDHRSLAAMALGGGRLLATSTPSHVLTVRDALTGVVVGPQVRLQGYTPILALTTVDGRAAVASTGDGLVLRDVLTGGEIVRHRHVNGGRHFAMLRGRLVVLASAPERGLRFVDVLSGEPIGAAFHAHPHDPRPVRSVEYEGRLLVASRDHAFGEEPVHLWDAETGAAVFTAPPPQKLEDFALALVDGRPLVLIGHRSGATLWDPVAGREVSTGLFDGFDEDAEKVALGALDDGFFAVLAAARGSGRPVNLFVSTSDGQRRIPLTEHRVNDVVTGLVDGRPTVAVSGEKCVLRLFDAATGREVVAPVYGGPLRDQHIVGVGGEVVLPGEPPRVWDVALGVPTRRLEGVGEWARIAAGAVDGRPTLVVVVPGKLSVGDLEIPVERHDHEAGATFTEVAGRPAVVAVSDAAIRAWDATTGAPVGVRYPLHTSARVLRAGRIGARLVVLAGGGDGSVHVVDPATGTAVVPPMRGHHEHVEALAFDEVDGRPLVVSGGRDHTVRVWDAATGEPVGRPWNGHGHRISSVHIARWQDRPVVVSTAWEGAPRLWHLDATTLHSGHTASVNAVAAGRGAFASGSDDRTVRLWDARTGAPLGDPLTGHEEPVTAVTFAGDILVSGDAGGLVLRWDGTRPEPLGRLGGRIVGLAAQGTAIAAASVDGTLRLWDAATGERVADLPVQGELQRCDLGTLDGRLVAMSVEADRDAWPTTTVTLWDVAAGKPLHAPVRVPEESDGFGALGVVDGKLLLAQGIDAEADEDEGFFPEEAARVQVIDVASRSFLGLMDHGGAFNHAAAFAGEVVLVGADRSVFVMDPHTGDEVGAAYGAHAADVTCVAATDVDGRTVVASGDLGNGVHIWDLATRTRV
ncbi:hypothetical protein Val02_09750 [Virgisporangium aliadipatigenens]|uniref:WD40 repeat domain-containing protein n=1 Tax=Virgisporangium aliadipatigenens TaxID=741659 RepID=A0A8J3YFB0_9ACTN|nr:hypothetical protein [Virgisporangium aliadipatigenens]GIJ44089.1 hypothetical protein Val02_09750 [Virgisporangium aliadipatigenens]